MTTAEYRPVPGLEDLADLVARSGDRARPRVHGEPPKVSPIEGLTAEQIQHGNQGADLTGLTAEQLAMVATNTPLWFYVPREAEFNNGLLGKVGGRIVAEVFHRAMEGSRISIVREPWWRPTLGPDSNPSG